MNNMNQFLNYFHNENESVIKVFKYIEKLNRKCMIQIKLQDVQRENKNGDVYFVVNSGGDKNNMINKFNAVFIDLDAGRDDNGEYFSSDIVNNYKSQKINEIKKFELPPTFIIETRNGYHIYWLLKDSTDNDTWHNCMNKLIVKFDSDKQVNNEARLMRLPFTYWMKDKSNPFYINIVEFNDAAYTIDEILDYLSDISINHVPIKSPKKSPHNNKNNNTNTPIIVGVKTPCGSNDDSNGDGDGYYNIKAISERNVKYLKSKINNEKIIFQNNEEYMTYIKQEIDLGKFLEFKYPNSIKCLFHDDNNPSAGIFKNDNGDWIYHCFGCGISYNILQVIERLGKFKSRPKAHRFIREIFNIEISETEWQKEQKEILLENLKVLISGELEQSCPSTYQNIKRNIKFLEQLHMIAIDNVRSEKMTDNEDNVMFFASARHIAKQMNMSENSAKEISKKSVLFQYHNLINKLDDSELPEDFLKRAAAISLNSEDKNKKYRHVNCFSIPSYTTAIFNDIENQGQKWKDNNYSMTGCSREMFYRVEGQNVANKMFPQYKQVYDKTQKEIVDRRTTKRSDDRTKIISEILCDYINQQDYVIETEIIDQIIINEIIKTTKKELQKQLKKSMQEILDTYDLKRIRTNKNIKEQYGITSEGYPFIIVKN